MYFTLKCCVTFLRSNRFKLLQIRGSDICLSVSNAFGGGGGITVHLCLIYKKTWWCQDYNPQCRLRGSCRSYTSATQINPHTRALAACVPLSTHAGWESSPPPTQFSNTSVTNPLTNQHFQKPSAGMWWAHVSYRSGCNQLVYLERRLEPTRASCFAPLEQIHPYLRLLLLISLCCW